MEFKLKKLNVFKKITIGIIFCYILSSQLVVLANVDIKSNNTKAAVLIEEGTGKVLYDYNKDAILPQASVTKLMTYYIARDYLKSTNTPLTKKITVDADFSMVPPDGTQLKLVKGDVITIQELLASLMIMSANDSAIELEKMIEEATKKNFIDIMNTKAKEIGLTKTTYINPSGLSERTDKEAKYNTTTAYETAILAKKIIDDYPDTLKITSQKSFKFKDVVYPSTNKLLEVKPNVDGLKTGYTTEAGYCIAVTESIKKTSNDIKPFRVVAVTLGSDTNENRTAVNTKLLNYAEQNFENKKIVKKETNYNLTSKYHKGGVIPAHIKDDVYYLVNKKDKVEVKALIKDKLKNSVKKGDIVGKLQIKVNNVTMEEDLIATKDVKKVNIFKRIGLFFQELF